MLAVLLQTQTSLLDRGLSLLGVFVCIGIAYLLSVDRSKVDWKVVGWGVLLQFVFGLIVLHPYMQQFFFKEYLRQLEHFYLSLRKPRILFLVQ